MAVASSIGAILMAFFVFFMRMKSSNKPISAKKIILPPIFMSTGALMYVFPEYRLTPMEIMESVALGVLFSTLLIKTSKFEIRDNNIYLKRSKSFIYILASLLVIRMAGKMILSTTINYEELSGMFFLLAFAMILPWRIAMYLHYRKLYSKLQSKLL